MRKVFHVAWREFVATVATKGFIIGILMTPLIVGVMIVVLPLLLDDKPPKVSGQVAVLDPTGEVVDGVRSYLTPQALAERRAREIEAVAAVAEEQLGDLDSLPTGAFGRAMESALGEAPELEVVSLPATSDVEEEKLPLLDATSAADGGRLALVVVHDDAVRSDDDRGSYGSYDLFVREKLDDRIEDEIREGLRHSILAARIRAQGLDPAEIQALTRVRRNRSTTVTEEGEKATNQILNMLLPVGFLVLLFVSVLTGGQYLMTTTIEEKSSRVVEVLLSAVSPMELMTGKIVGQMCVGLLILALYGSMGMVALVTFAFTGLVDPWLFFYLILFYLIAYFVVASLMAAIGSAVNEMREAQTLMTPIMFIFMVPWFLWMPISRDPNSTFSLVTSLVPPFNTFAMLLRMASTDPPPLWQTWLSIAIGVLSVYAALWFAAKVFRVGLLMYGKPPNLATLVRWVRMA